ncbi:hypothetical protein [Streptomyces sp. NBC_00354]|uniref:hypothetical protein n=1 Tax=Streptomyces sp. NBC_00354 TaxID=2975723 RepID=UPI002E254A05
MAQGTEDRLVRIPRAGAFDRPAGTTCTSGYVATRRACGWGRAGARAVRAGTVWGQWRDVALVCVCGALAFYLWGCLHLLFLDDTRQFEACLEAGGPQRAARVDAFEGDFVPLRLLCRIDEGGSYSAGVPGYVNTLVAVLAIGAVVTGALATAERTQLEKNPAKGNER